MKPILIPIIKKIEVRRGLGMVEEANVSRHYELSLNENMDSVFFTLAEKAISDVPCEMVAGAAKQLAPRHLLHALGYALIELAKEIPDDIL